MNSQDKSKKSGALRRPAKSNSLGILIILLAMCLLLTSLSVRSSCPRAT